MPTYEYTCKACGEHCEVVQSFKDSPLTECAACGGQLRKVFGNIGITFKGSGFYKTDSRSDGRKAEREERGNQVRGGIRYRHWRQQERRGDVRLIEFLWLLRLLWLFDDDI